MVPTQRTVDPLRDAYGALYMAIKPDGDRASAGMLQLADAMTQKDYVKAASVLTSLLPLFRDQPEQSAAIKRMRYELSK